MKDFRADWKKGEMLLADDSNYWDGQDIPST